MSDNRAMNEVYHKSCSLYFWKRIEKCKAQPKIMHGLLPKFGDI